MAQKAVESSDVEISLMQIHRDLQQIEQAYNRDKIISPEQKARLTGINGNINQQEQQIGALEKTGTVNTGGLKKMSTDLDSLKARYSRVVAYARSAAPYNSAPPANTNYTWNRQAANTPLPEVKSNSSTGSYLNYQNEANAVSAAFELSKGMLPHPVNGVITLGFGRYKVPGPGPEIVGYNPGVSYSTSVGAPVQAIFSGQVASVSKVGDMSFVVLRHGKYSTAYSNLKSADVSKGMTITAGQLIGTAGADDETGRGKLDFILMLNKQNIDPRGWLR